MVNPMDKKSRRKIPPFDQWPDWVILVFFFSYSLIVGLLIQFILLPYVFPSFHAGEGLLIGLDSRAFHRQAVELSSRIASEGWQAWELTPQPVAGIAAIFYALISPHPWVMLPLNSLLHALAGWMLFKTLAFFLDRRMHAFLAALPLLLFPSALSWVTQMHNDNYAVAGAILMLYAWVCFARESSWENKRLILGGFLSLVGGISLTWLVRDYVVSMYTGVGVILLLFCIILFVARWRRKKWKWQRTLAATGIVCLAFFLTASFQIFDLGTSDSVVRQNYLGQPTESTGTDQPELQPGDKGFRTTNLWKNTSWLPSWIDSQMEGLSITRYKAIRSTWTETRGGSNIDTDINFRNVMDIVKYLPRAIEIGFLSPFPSDWLEQGSKAPNTMMRRVSGLEMVFVYISFIGLLAAFWTWRKRPEFWIAILFCFGLVLIYTLGTPNVGTLYRLRYPFLMALVGMGTAGWIILIKVLKEKRKASPGKRA
jgi:hypothetical protein